MENYFVVAENGESGPYPEPEIAWMVKAGKLLESGVVRRDGSPEKCVVASLAFMRPAAAADLPQRAQRTQRGPETPAGPPTPLLTGLSYFVAGLLVLAGFVQMQAASVFIAVSVGFVLVGVGQAVGYLARTAYYTEQMARRMAPEA